MKLLNKKSFILLVAGFAAYWLYQIITFIVSLADIDAQIARQAELYETLGLDTDGLRGIVIGTSIFSLLIVIGLTSIFFFKALAHRKTPKKGTYLTVLLVFIIIFAALGLIDLISGIFTVFIVWAFYALFIAAIVIQKSNKTPFVQPDQPYYGQPYPPNAPYGPNPYGQQNPYQQPNPYGQQPQGPYGQQPQNPYRNEYNENNEKDNYNK